jgi:type I restriction enzyme, R subunit
MSSTYITIAENPHSTVVAEYIPAEKGAQAYQSEAELEAEFIRLLQGNGYHTLTLRSEADLLQNLRTQLSTLNQIVFTDAEWTQFCNDYLANKAEGIEEKTTKVQENYIYNLRRDDGTTKNIRILDKDNIHNNTVQVINQYEAEGARKNRYDVTVLVNGLPMVHIELKRRGVAIREAFNQINRYQRDSFWADSGLFEYVQLFVITNGTHTKYYSNTTRNAHLKEQAGKKSGKKTSNSFEFTSWWTDAQNKRITDLVDFAKTFFSKHSLLSILTRYCVFTTDKLLLVMRPYQIAAAERILNRIAMSTNHKQLGTVEAGGYIWHTTGSGKTLTSFKTAQLASRLNGIDKVIFVVDRKDLDYQTMKEYDKFEKGSANSNTSTAILTKQLSDPNARIIITTIQKLDRFIGANARFILRR